MPKKLPFKVEPKSATHYAVGDETVGIIEIPKYGSLTPAEMIYIEEMTKELPSLQEETIKVSQEIAAESGLGLYDVYNAMVSGDINILQKHLPAFMKLKQIQQKSVPTEKYIRATAILCNRIDKEWTYEDTGNPDLIHPGLVKAIAEFALNEENGWDIPEEPKEEDLKKVSEEKEPVLTGAVSTGE